MVRKLLLSICLSVIALSVFSQSFKVNGVVKDKKTQEPVVGAVVYELYTTENGTSTDPDGFFSISFEKSKARMKVAYIGYKDTILNLSLYQDTTLTIFIESQTDIEEVEIEDDEIIWTPDQDSLSGKVKVIEAELVEELPAIEEKELINPILYNKKKPGSLSDSYVQKGRGATRELMFIDGVRVYNSAMNFDFLPFIQDEALSGYKRYIGNFPAKFGGTLSSVNDIFIKEGNNSFYEGSVRLDLMGVGLSVEGPVINNTSSLYIGTRITYLDNPYANLFMSDLSSSDQYWLSPGFYDLNIKYVHKISENDKLNLTYFSNMNSFKTDVNEELPGSEEYNFSRNIKSAFSNYLASLNWQHIYTPMFVSNFSLNYSKYSLKNKISGDSIGSLVGETGSLNNYDANYKSSDSELSLKLNFMYYFNTDHKLNFGANIINYHFLPIKAELLLNDFENNFSIDTSWKENGINVQEYTLFVDDQIKFNDKLFVNAGLHFSAFTNKGKSYYSIQPRIYAEYELFKGFSIHASYAHYKQYIHYLSNNSVGLSADVFYPSDNTVLPQLTNRFAGGVKMNLPFDIHLNADVFYDRMSNVVEYNYGFGFFDFPGSNNLPGTNLSERIVQGKSNLYGFQVVLKKEINNLTVMAGHTLSNYDRNFSEMLPEQNFQYRYNRRFDFDIKLNYALSDNFSLHAQYVFRSGNYVTVKKQSYIPYDYTEATLGTSDNEIVSYDWNGDLIENTGNINDFRLPSYARFDIGAEYVLNEHTFGIKIYNLLNKRNADFVDYQKSVLSNSPTDNLVKYSMMPFFPTVTYSYRFK